MPNLRLNSRPGPLPAALAACGLLAMVTLAAPIEPLYDPWAWLVWGREATGFDLDTSVGPSWKPLPVLIAAPLAASGDWAPDLWLALVRLGWLAVPVLAWRLAARLEGSSGPHAVFAGLAAAAAVVLMADEFTPWIRQGAGGLSEPLLAALVLGAVEAALAGRVRWALGLALAACLLRPEAWPFAAAYAWREARAGRVRPLTVAAGVALVPVLWFVPDLMGAGNALEGAERARGSDNSPLEVLGWAAEMPLAALWVGVGLAVWPWRGRLSESASTLTWGAATWIGIVAVMACAGYAGLPRFMAPAVAVLCAVGAAGLVRAVASVRRGAAWAAATAVLVLGAQGALRAADLPGELDSLREESAPLEALSDLVSAGPEAFMGCGELWTSVFITQTALAWHLDLAVSDVVTTSSVPPPDGRLVVGAGSDAGLAARARADGSPLAADGGWEVYGTGACASAAG